jgi:hypothetical protein
VKDERKDDTEIPMVSMAQGDVTKRKHDVDNPTAPPQTSGNGWISFYCVGNMVAILIFSTLGNSGTASSEGNGDNNNVMSNVVTALGLNSTDEEKASAKKELSPGHSAPAVTLPPRSAVSAEFSDWH